MAQKKLTAVSIPNLPPGTHADLIVPGLQLIIGRTRRTWAYRYRSGGKRPKLTLGYFPRMGLAEARASARKASERIECGVPPAGPAPHPRSPTALTLGALLDRYEVLRTREGRRTKSLPQAMGSLRRNLQPCLSLPAAQFSKADLRAARDALVEADNVIAGNRARLPRACDALGRARGFDPDQLRPGHPPRARGKAQPCADQKRNRQDLEGLRRSRHT